MLKTRKKSLSAILDLIAESLEPSNSQAQPGNALPARARLRVVGTTQTPSAREAKSASEAEPRGAVRSPDWAEPGNEGLQFL